MATQLMPGTTLLDSFFRDFPGLTPGYFLDRPYGKAALAAGQIRIDVKESDSTYTLQAELPGLSKDEINVSLDHNVVTLRAEVKQEKQADGGEKVLRNERFYGAIARSFALPQHIDEAKAKAKYDQGVLTLMLPKKQTSSSQRLIVE
ncbi:MAG: Hsp20/alpha crystallin family protein [Burkholderiaceae bacterium]|jgi:HSP20 family protein|nr:Hsp20/alpha crystallin family protein [Burkholderiaceae bacterium]